MKVYVFGIWFRNEGGEVLKVFSKQSDAKKYMKRMDKEEPQTYADYFIEEYELE